MAVPTPKYAIEQITCKPGTPLFDAAYQLIRNNIRRIPEDRFQKTIAEMAVFGALTSENDLLGVGIAKTNVPHDKLNRTPVTRLAWLAVDPQFRYQYTQPRGFVRKTPYDTSYRQKGRGIGTAILQKIETYSITQGDSAICLYSSSEAQGFYKRLGYERLLLPDTASPEYAEHIKYHGQTSQDVA